MPKGYMQISVREDVAAAFAKKFDAQESESWNALMARAAEYTLVRGYKSEETSPAVLKNNA